jgi:hypothetical protein
MRHNKDKFERRMTIWGVEYKLNRVIEATEKDIHHILSRKMANKFNVNNPKNKIEIQRRKHIHLNWLFLDHQNPRDQLRDMLEIWKTALSEEVRTVLYDILSLDDEWFYDYDLVKKHKILKNKL